jgi:hypothetical protein
MEKENVDVANETSASDEELRNRMQELTVTLRTTFNRVNPSIEYRDEIRPVTVPSLDDIIKQFGLDSDLEWKYCEGTNAFDGIRNDGRKEIDGRISLHERGMSVTLGKTDEGFYGAPGAHILRYSRIDPMVIDPRLPRAPGQVTLSYLNNLRGGKYTVTFRTNLP